MTFNLADYFLFDRLAEGLADKVAIRFGDLEYNYGEIAKRSRAVHAGLAAAGVMAEQRVFIVLPDTPPFAWAFFGTLASGAVVAMGNPAATDDSLGATLEYTRAAVLITTPDVAKRLAKPIADAAHIKAVWLVPDVSTGEDPEGPTDGAAFSDIAHGTPEPSTHPTTADDVAIWLFTSGSTGRPKAAVHSHEDFRFNTENYAINTVGYRRDDVTVSVPCLYFGYATGTNLMFPFRVGATVGLFSERPTPEALTNAIERYSATIVTNVPTMMSKLLSADDANLAAGGPGIDMAACRFHLSAGEALPPALLERFVARWPVDVYDGIGSAEMFHIYATNRPGDIKPGSLGRVVDGYTIRILAEDADGPGAPELPRGETGVMWVKGASVAHGYFGDRKKSWATFFGSWCRTGDLFRMDADDYLWFSGRADSLLKVSGQWVAPLEVEQCLMRHPSVALAAVIGAQREELQRVKAFVVPRESAAGALDDPTELTAELRAFVKRELMPHKAPQWVVWMDDLPRNDRGKIDRKALVERETAGVNPWQ
ncbi:MAG: benzoate-CoA ligase family protein [Myxococcota bacterium]|jgi:benzoate-CoA ligase family protein